MNGVVTGKGNFTKYMFSCTAGCCHLRFVHRQQLIDMCCAKLLAVTVWLLTAAASNGNVPSSAPAAPAPAPRSALDELYDTPQPTQQAQPSKIWRCCLWHLAKPPLDCVGPAQPIPLTAMHTAPMHGLHHPCVKAPPALTVLV